MEIGEINKGAVVLILVLLLGAGGYLWYTKMYSPAVADRDVAQGEVAAAESSLVAAKAELARAQEQFEAAKTDSKKTDDSVARVAKARTAVPDKRMIDDAAIVLKDMADRSGVNTFFKSGDSGASAVPEGDTTGLQGAVPIDVSFKAAGTYSEMMQFMSLIEGSVERKGDTLHTRGRLFNVVQLKIGEEDESAGSTGQFGMDSGGPADDELVVGPNDIVFTVVVRMYTSSTENSQGVGSALPEDPAAAGTDPNAAGMDPNAAGTADGSTPPADGSAPADPGAAQPQADPAGAAA